jgi:hypothetical protein
LTTNKQNLFGHGKARDYDTTLTENGTRGGREKKNKQTNLLLITTSTTLPEQNRKTKNVNYSETAAAEAGHCSLHKTTQQQHNDRSSSTEEIFCFFFIPGNETDCFSSCCCSHDLQSLFLALFSRSSPRIPQEPDGRASGRRRRRREGGRETTTLGA